MEIQNTETGKVATELRAELARRKMSGRAFAKASGVTNAYMTRRLSGEVAMTVDDLTLFAAVLNVPVTRFFPEAA